MALAQLETYDYHNVGSDPEFRALFETHRMYLMRHPKTRDLIVGNNARPFFYNLYGYLIETDINPKLHWLILMLSDLESPEDFDSSVTTLRCPDLATVEEIIALAGL